MIETQNSERTLLNKTRKANRSFSIDVEALIKNNLSNHQRKNYFFTFFFIASTICSASFGVLMLSLPSTPLIKLLWRNLFATGFLLPFIPFEFPFKEFFRKNNFLEKIRKYFVGGFWFTLTSILFCLSLHNAGLGVTCILANFDVFWTIFFRAIKRNLSTLWKRVWIGIVLCLFGIMLCFYYSQNLWLFCALLSSISSSVFNHWGDSIKEKFYWTGYFCIFLISCGYLMLIIFLFDGMEDFFNTNSGFFALFSENTFVNVVIVSLLTSLGSSGIIYSISQKITPSLHSLSILSEPIFSISIGSLLGLQSFFSLSLWISIFLTFWAYYLIKKEENIAEDVAAEKIFYDMEHRDEPEQEMSVSFLWMKKPFI